MLAGSFSKLLLFLSEAFLSLSFSSVLTFWRHFGLYLFLELGILLVARLFDCYFRLIRRLQPKTWLFGSLPFF